MKGTIAGSSTDFAIRVEETRESEMGPSQALCGAETGLLVGLSGDGGAYVECAGPAPCVPVYARTVVNLTSDRIGHEVLIVFERGDRTRPIIVGVLNRSADEGTGSPHDPRPLEISTEDGRVVFSAEKELVLRCGKASITLTESGRILVRGTYLLSRSTGLNRIQGGSVQIN